jgi:hypothetical protein
MAFAGRKLFCVTKQETLLGSESEESLSDLECDSENELDDCTVLDVVMDGDSDQDIIQDFLWEDMNNYKGQRENFTGSVGPQGAVKQVTNCGCLRIIFQQGICGKNC